MPLKNPARPRRKGPPPGETGQESLYLRFLSEKQVPIAVKLRDGESVYGWIEYFDDRMIRLTRDGKPNLFIYKNQIRTISEIFRNIEGRRRERHRDTVATSAIEEHVAAEIDASVELVVVKPVSKDSVEFEGRSAVTVDAHRPSKEPIDA